MERKVRYPALRFPTPADAAGALLPFAPGGEDFVMEEASVAMLAPAGEGLEESAPAVAGKPDVELVPVAIPVTAESKISKSWLRRNWQFNGRPAYVSLASADRRELENPRYLGAAHKPFQYGYEGMHSIRPHWSVSPERLRSRASLIRSFDQLRRDIDVQREVSAMDTFQQQALDLITSAKARDAFDLSKELSTRMPAGTTTPPHPSPCSPAAVCAPGGSSAPPTRKPSA
jgi:hypothetical protein